MIHKLKHSCFAFLTLLFLANIAFGDELISIDNYLKKNNFNDPIVKLNTYDQCSGLILMLLGETKHKKMPVKFSPLMENGYVDVTKATIYLIGHSFKDPASVERKEEFNMNSLVKLYVQYAKSLEIAGRNKFDDPLINSDLKSCIKIIKEAKK